MHPNPKRENGSNMFLLNFFRSSGDGTPLLSSSFLCTIIYLNCVSAGCIVFVTVVFTVVPVLFAFLLPMNCVTITSIKAIIKKFIVTSLFRFSGAGCFDHLPCFIFYAGWQIKNPVRISDRVLVFAKRLFVKTYISNPYPVV